MATPKSQRIGIWIIAVVLTIGTLGSFVAIILSNQNQQSDQAKIQQESNQYTAAVSSQTKQLSDKYYTQFSAYAKTPAAFDASSVTKLVTTDLKIGDGAVLKSGSAYSAYYIGWNPKGVIFDQSIDSGALKAPIAGGSLITGWEQGVVGMKFDGIRELTIPSSLAYGATGSGANIPANTPIKFVVMVIPKVTEITIPPELLQYYESQQQSSGS
ncbi:MAG TPA: FKBP-type peptidyl-prolyl cis-trans isomerase [Candidatus Saccharimonadales bacterium]|nr:FKBP-type peptidyl-prolyl cis-trans isomerase [Candidatus Saccharimonadales bacterium]